MRRDSNERRHKMEFDYAIYSLSDEFYRMYPDPPYKEILKKQSRGYACLLFQSHYGYFICVPYRSEISHKYAYHFRSSKRSQKHKSGIDYTKAVIIKELKYLDKPILIDQDEYAETRKNIFYIAKKAEEYVETYKKYLKGEKKISNEEFFRRYRCTSLKYFHRELDI